MSEIIGRCANCDTPYIPERYAGGRDDPTVNHPTPPGCAKCGGTTLVYTVTIEPAPPTGAEK